MSRWTRLGTLCRRTSPPRLPMNPDLFGLNLPAGEALPPATREAMEGWQDEKPRRILPVAPLRGMVRADAGGDADAEPFVMN